VSVGSARAAALATATALAAIAAIHVAWGVGSSFPFRDRETLADVVVGNDVVPGAAESFAVAALLGAAAALVGDAAPLPRPLRTAGVLSVAGVLATRAAFGFTGSTAKLVPGSDSPRFRSADRRLFSPLCTALAIGSAASAIAPRRRVVV
jgi:hypothetical protein